MENQNKLLIIVAVRNLWKRYTEPMLKSIKVSKMPYAVFLVDNGSTDETKNLKDMEWESADGDKQKVMLFKRNEENKGCSGAWNQGIEWGLKNGFTHFLIPNNDILLNARSVDALLERFEKGDVGCVASVDVSGEIRIPEEIFTLAPKEASEAPNPNFSCFLISKDTIEKVGMFDEGFFPAYFEDNDYHYRLKKAYGLNGAITITGSVFYHYGSRTQNESGDKPVVPGGDFEKNRAYFIQKWGGSPGNEKYEHPFNTLANDIKHVTKRN